MILNEKNRSPQITFGLGVTEKTISLGDSVTIYQQTVYNTDEFELIFNLAAKNIYQFQYTPIGTGTEELTVNVVTKDGKINMVSKPIILTIV